MGISKKGNMTAAFFLGRLGHASKKAITCACRGSMGKIERIEMIFPVRKVALANPSFRLTASVRAACARMCSFVSRVVVEDSSAEPEPLQ